MDPVTLAAAKQSDPVGALLIEDAGNGALACLAGAVLALKAQRRMGLHPSVRTALIVAADVSVMLRGSAPPRAADQARRAHIRKDSYLTLRRQVHRILRRHVLAAVAGTRIRAA